MQDPRYFQSEAIENVRYSLKTRHKRPLLVSPCGSGKTHMAAGVIKMALAKGNRVLFLAPYRELVIQTSRAFGRLDIPNGIIMADHPSDRYAPAQVASKDTLMARGVNKNIDAYLPPADLIIIDEAHLSVSDGWKALLSKYPGVPVIGLTATPCRMDGRGLGEIYDDLVVGATTKQLTEEGYLSPAEYYGADIGADFAGLKTVAGDYVVGGKSGVASRMDKPQIVGNVVDNWQRIAWNKKTVVFCCNRAHGRHVLAEFVKRGVRAAYIDGETPTDERLKIMAGIRSEDIQVIVNVMVFVYGVDVPSLECAVLAFKTKSVAKYLQAIGRVLRISPGTGKDHATIIDHGGHVTKLGRADDDWEWTLEGDTTVQERKEKRTKERKEVEDSACQSCGYLFKKTRRAPNCPKCGQVHLIPHKTEDVDVVDADLELLGKKVEARDTPVKRDFYRQLKSIQVEKGYAPGWVFHKFVDKYGHEPGKSYRGLDPIPATVPVRNWVKNRLIRWAKGQKRAAK